MENIKNQILELNYSLRDIEMELSELRTPEHQISSAKQLTDLNLKREHLLNMRNVLRKEKMMLEGRLKQEDLERDRVGAAQHRETRRLGMFGIGIDIVGTALGVLFK